MKQNLCDNFNGLLKKRWSINRFAKMFALFSFNFLVKESSYRHHFNKMHLQTVQLSNLEILTFKRFLKLNKNNFHF